MAARLRSMHWSDLHLKGFRASERRAVLFIEALNDERLMVRHETSTANGGTVDNLVCPYIDLPGTFDHYLETRLSRSTRQKVRRFTRRIDGDADYRITTTTPATRTQDVDALEYLWAAMWRHRKGQDTDHLAAKYAMIVNRGLEDSLARLCIMWHRERPIGALASFVDWEKARLLFS